MLNKRKPMKILKKKKKLKAVLLTLTRYVVLMAETEYLHVSTN